MKFQNPSLNSVLTGRTDGRTDERTSQNQYAPHFFKVGGIIINVVLGFNPLKQHTTNNLCDYRNQTAYFLCRHVC